MSVLGYFARHSFVRIATYGIGVISAFLVTPHILKCLGASVYGTWALISSLANYYLLLDFGLYQAVAKKSAAAQAKGDGQEAEGIFATAFLLGLGGCLLVLLIGGSLAFFTERFEQNLVNGLTLGLCIFLFSASIGVQLLLRSAQGMLAGAMHWTFLAMLSMLRILATSTAVLILLHPEQTAAENLFALACITALCNLLEPCAHLLLVRFRLGIGLRLSLASKTQAGALLHFGASILGAQLGDLLRNHTQIYVVAALLGTGQTALFSIARQFINYMNDVILSAFGILSPYFSRLESKGDTNGYRDALIDALRLSFSVSCLIGLALIFYGELFIIRWLGSQFSEAAEVLIPLAMGGLISCGGMPANAFLIGLGKHRILAIYTLMQGAIITLGSIPLAMWYGLPSIGWLVFATTLVFNLGLLPIRVCQAASMPRRRYYIGAMTWALLPQITGQSLYFWFVSSWLKPEYPAFFLAGTGQALTAGLIFLLTAKVSVWLGRLSKQP